MEGISMIKKIDDMVEMAKVMKTLGISSKGIQTLDDMKQKVIEEIRESQKNAEWSLVKAFSEFAAIRDEDITKRKKLEKIYNKVEEILENCKPKLLESINCFFNGGVDVKEEIKTKKEFTREHILLFAGETGSGKSRLINLILGEDYLPYGKLPTTSTICEVRHGSSRGFKIYYNDANKETKECRFSDPNQGKSYVDQLAPYLQQRRNREKRSPIKKIELFLPHEVLKDGIVIVDSPGIGEYPEKDSMVSNYLREAFFFVYVINSENAGGVHEDRLLKLLELAKQQSGKDFVPEDALFVCNKWDMIENDKEKEEITEYIIEKLKWYWPNLDCHTQIVKLSVESATDSKKYGMISPQFMKFIDAVKSMMLRAVKARLGNDCRFLDAILSRTHFHTTTIIRNQQRDRPEENLGPAKMMLKKFKAEYESCIAELENKLQSTTREIVKRVTEHFQTGDFIQEFAAFAMNECSEITELNLEAESEIQKIMSRKLSHEFNKWAAENEEFKEALESMMKLLQADSERLEFQIKAVEEIMIKETTTSDDASLNPTTLSLYLGLTSPIWLPLVIVGGILRLPFVSVAIKNFIEKELAKKLFKVDKKTYITARSVAFLNEPVIEKELSKIIEERFQIVTYNLNEMKSNFTKLFEMDMGLIDLVRERNLQLRELAAYYDPINQDCKTVRGELSIFTIREINANEIDPKNLQWSNVKIGMGSFACVFKGSLKTSDGQEVNVALKKCKKILTKENAYQLLHEELILRSIDHKNVVKFYGRVLQQKPVGTKFIFVMELCKESLKTYIEVDPICAPGRAPEEAQKTAITDMLKWGKDIASGLMYLHGKQIVHRDLKPDNILIGLDGKTLKIADVGLAKHEKEITGSDVGTPLYMAPEVFSGNVYDNRADIYSFGLILWELWYGTTVFPEITSFNELRQKVTSGQRPIHCNDCFAILPQLDTLMRNCWETESENRLEAVQCLETINSILESWKKST